MLALLPFLVSAVSAPPGIERLAPRGPAYGSGSLPGAVSASPDDQIADVPLSRLTWDWDVLVDDARRRVYVTGGGDSGDIAVVGFDGTFVRYVPEAGARGMVLSADGRRLFVAPGGGTAIDVFDMTSDPPARAGRIETGPDPLVGHLALAGGRLWFDQGICGRTDSAGNWRTGIGSVAPDAAAPDPRTYHGLGFDNHYCGLGLSSFAQTPGLLFGTSDFASVYEFDVGPGGDARLVASADDVVDSDADRLSMTPDGTRVVVPTNSFRAQLLRVADLEPAGDPCVIPGAVAAAAVSASGVLTVSGRRSPASVWTLDVRDGTCSARNAFVLGDARSGPQVQLREALAGDALRYSADESLLFVVTHEAAGAVHLHVIDQPTGLPSTVSIAVEPLAVQPGTEPVLSGQLVFGDDPAAGRPIRVAMARPDGTSSELGSVTTDDEGGWSLRAPALAAPGAYTFDVAFAGDTHHRRSSASLSVRVDGPRRVTAPDSAVAFGIDTGHSNLARNSSASLPLELAWLDGLPGVPSSSIVAGNRIFVVTWTPGSSVSNLWALRTADGAPAWGPVPFAGVGTPAFDEGRVFVSSNRGGVVAVDARSGDVGWQRDVGENVELSMPVARNGLLVLHSSGGIWALDEATGAIRWKRFFDDGGLPPVIMSRDTVFVNGYHWQVRAFGYDGHLRWHEGDGMGAGSPSSFYRGRLFVRDIGDVTTDGIRDAATGELLGDFVAATPAAFSGGTGFFVQGRSCGTTYGSCRLWAVDLASGRTLWEFDQDPAITTAPLVVDGVVYVSSAGWMYGLDAATGRVLWTFNFGIPVTAPFESRFMSMQTTPTAGSGLLLVPLGSAFASGWSLAAFRPAGPAVTFGPNMPSFGAGRVGTTHRRTLAIRNTGGSALHLAGVHLEGDGELRVGDDGCSGRTLDPNESCRVVLEFRPSGRGWARAVLSLTDDAGGSPQSIAVTGRGV
jgi:outer membrane protein assembly factor BamB